ncbi:MAG TPA: hypothetical protein VK864_07715, partial [Longimicrobiales bacterium]|nr:hypothetical protein [Longimicrobiales bacterium]
ADDRLLFWSQLRELAGHTIPLSVRERITDAIEGEYEQKLTALRAEYETKLAELKSQYPRQLARRFAEGLLRPGNRNQTVAQLLERAESIPDLEPISLDAGWTAAPPATNGGAHTPAPAPVVTTPAPTPNGGAASAVTATAVAEAPADSDDLALEAYIETERCTSCNECTNLNNRMFAYNESKQAYLKDVHAGTFAQLVTAAERCPAGLIHPGSPVNPKEKGLEKWTKRAEPFN